MRPHWTTRFFELPNQLNRLGFMTAVAVTTEAARLPAHPGILDSETSGQS